jgi:hypothetical protein
MEDTDMAATAATAATVEAEDAADGVTDIHTMDIHTTMIYIIANQMNHRL